MKKKLIPVAITCCALFCVATVVATNYNKPVSEAANTATEQEDIIMPSDKELTEAEKEERYNEEMEKKIKEVLSDTEGIKSVALEREDKTIVVNVNVDTTFDATKKDDITDLVEVVYPDFQIEVNILEESL